MKHLRTAALLAAGTILAAGCAQTEPAATAAPLLSGTTYVWKTTGAETEHFIAFDEKGGVHGQSGCNGFFGGVKVEGDAVAFTNLGSTMKMCAPEAMEVEARFMKALTETKRVRQSETALDLLNGEGAVLLTLERKN